MFKKVYFTICFLLFLLVLILAFITFKPIRNVTNADVVAKTGIVKRIQSGSGGDIYISLQNDTHDYYINNAFNEGLMPEKLKAEILEKEVTLYHIKRWTPVSTDGVFPHISKLQIKNKVLFNEIID